jgi:hypothetical protein
MTGERLDLAAAPSAEASALLRRIGEHDRAIVHLEVDGAPIEARAGDTLLTALLLAGSRLRDSEFGDGPRAGFCLMGACQDCWVWTVPGDRLRACSTPVVAGMRILTRHPAWPIQR